MLKKSIYNLKILKLGKKFDINLSKKTYLVKLL